MKKIILIILCFGSILPFYSQRKSDNLVSYLSLKLSPGLNFFDGDIQPQIDGWKSNIMGNTLGASIDYTGMSILRTGVSCNYNKVAGFNYSYDFTSHQFHLINNFEINVIPLSRLFGIWLGSGIGINFFDSKLSYSEAQQHFSQVKSNSLIFPFSLSAEYNISQNISAGLTLRYLGYSRDDIEGGVGAGQHLNLQGVTNDFLSLVMLNFTWKFAHHKYW